jgi:branched-chain amino acid transport system ATP-binding protein
VRFGLRRSFQTEQVVEDLSVWDNVRALLDHVPHARAEAVAQVARALSHTDLLDVATVLGRRLNLFQRRMLEIAKSLVGAPKLLLLDEPGAASPSRRPVRCDA